MLRKKTQGGGRYACRLRSNPVTILTTQRHGSPMPHQETALQQSGRRQQPPVAWAQHPGSHGVPDRSGRWPGHRGRLPGNRSTLRRPTTSWRRRAHRAGRAGARTDQPSQQAADDPQETPDPGPTPEEIRTASLSYWEAIDTILAEHSSLELEAAQKWTGLQTIDFLTARQRGHRQTADRLAELDTRAVDPRLLEYGEKTLQWHNQASELFQEAVNISLGSPTGEFSGPHRSSWGASMKQHQMEKVLLIKRTGAIRAYVRGTYLSGTTPPATE